ncbi:hypothetical protein ANCCAN_09222, partial [Ancylostoma caninum]
MRLPRQGQHGMLPAQGSCCKNVSLFCCPCCLWNQTTLG